MNINVFLCWSLPQLFLGDKLKRQLQGICKMGMNFLSFDVILRTIPLDERVGKVITLGVQSTSVGETLFNVLMWRHCDPSKRAFWKPKSEPYVFSAAIQKKLTVLKENQRYFDSFNKKDVSVDRFFLASGYHSVLSLDASNFEGADIVFDLNDDIAGTSLVESANLIIDAGTMEHIFNVPQVLANIHSLLKVGGYVFHAVPLNNYAGHGFYQFTPHFFKDYYTQNGYEICYFSICNHGPGRWGFSECEIGIDIEGQERFSSSSGQDLILVIARKTKVSTCTAKVQQGGYKEVWSKHANVHRENNEE